MANSGTSDGIKALHFGRFYGSNPGGTERHVEQLLSALYTEIQVDNLVASDHCKTEVVSPLGYDIYKIASLGVLASTALCPAMPLWARRLHRQNDYDVVHLHFPDPLSHLAFSFLPDNVKLVISWHSDIVRQRVLLRLYRPFLDRILSRADAIIVATPRHIESSTQLRAVAGKCHVIPYGMDFSAFDGLQAQQDAQIIRQRHPGKVLLFALGRHVYYKGFEYLIRAMATVEGGHLLLGGIGPLSMALRELAQSLGLMDRITFLGRIPERDLPAYHNAADIFCLPSVEPSEAFGLVQLEAMACGKPVICSILGNGVNWVNQAGITGLEVPPRDSTALAAAINRLILNPAQRQQLGAAGKCRAHQSFSLEAMKQGTLSLYRALCGKPMNSPCSHHPRTSELL